MSLFVYRGKEVNGMPRPYTYHMDPNEAIANRGLGLMRTATSRMSAEGNNPLRQAQLQIMVDLEHRNQLEMREQLLTKQLQQVQSELATTPKLVVSTP